MAVVWLAWILTIQTISIANCVLNQGQSIITNDVLNMGPPRDPGPDYVGAELHAKMEAAALKALSIIDEAAKFTDEAEHEQSEKGGLPNIRFKRQENNPIEVKDQFPADESVRGEKKSPEEEQFEAEAEAVIHQGLEVEPRLKNNLAEMSQAAGLEPLSAEPVVLAEESTVTTISSIASSPVGGNNTAGTGSTIQSSTKFPKIKGHTKFSMKMLKSKKSSRIPIKSSTTSSSIKLPEIKVPPKEDAVIQEINLPGSERVVEEEFEIVETNLNDEPLHKASPDADAVRAVPGILQVNEMERERFDFEPRGEKVSEDYQYGGQDYADSTSDSGSKDNSGADEIKKVLTVEKVDSMIELMNVLNKDFGSILAKWDRAPNPKDTKESKDKDSKDKDSKGSKDSKDSKDGKGAKSDYDYDAGSQSESSSSTTETTSTSSKSRPVKHGKRKRMSRMSSMAPKS